MSELLDDLKAVRATVYEGWTTDALAEDRFGDEVHPRFNSACCWCLWGAAIRVCSSTDRETDVFTALGFATVDGVTEWNDEPGRTQGEVLALIDQTIERLAA